MARFVRIFFLKVSVFCRTGIKHGFYSVSESKS